MTTLIQPGVPSGTAQDLTGTPDGTAYILGMDVVFATPGTIDAVWFLTPSAETPAATVGFAVGVTDDTTVLRSAGYQPPLAGSGWRRYEIGTEPLEVPAGATRRISVRTNRYPFVTEAFDFSAGPLTAVGGRFTANPGGSGINVVPETVSTTWYGLDVEFTAAQTTTTVLITTERVA